MTIVFVIMVMSTLIVCSLSLGNGRESRKIMRGAIEYARIKCIQLEKEIKAGQPKGEGSILSYKKELNEGQEPFQWSDLLDELGYVEQEIFQMPDGTLKNEDSLELAMEFNHLKSLWYKFRAHHLHVRIHQISQIKTYREDSLQSYKNALSLATESFKKHYYIYERYKNVLECCLRVVEINHLESNAIGNGYTFQYIPHMVEATKTLEHKIQMLKAYITSEGDLKMTISRNKANKYLGSLYRDYMPKLIEYTARHLSEPPDKYPRSKEYLEFGKAYHEHEWLDCQIRAIELERLFQKKNIKKDDYGSKAYLKRSQKHKEFFLVYKDAFDKFQSYKPTTHGKVGEKNFEHKFENRRSMRDAIANLGAWRGTLERTIKRERNTEALSFNTQIIDKWLKQMNEKLQWSRWLTISKNFEFDIEKLSNKPDETFRIDDYLELVMEYNHFRSVWYRLYNVVLYKKVRQTPLTGEKRKEYERGLKLADELMSEHDDLYIKDKEVLENYLRHIGTGITEVDISEIDTRDDGCRLQYKRDMLEATKMLKLSNKRLETILEQNRNVGLPILFNTFASFLFGLGKRPFWVPEGIKYTTLSLSDSPDNHPRSKEFLEFGTVYHQHESLWYEVFAIIIDNFCHHNDKTLGSSEIAEYTDAATIARKHSEKHKLHFAEYNKSMNKYQQDLPLSRTTNSNNDFQFPDNSYANHLGLNTKNNEYEAQNDDIVKQNGGSASVSATLCERNLRADDQQQILEHVVTADHCSSGVHFGLTSYSNFFDDFVFEEGDVAVVETATREVPKIIQSQLSSLQIDQNALVSNIFVSDYDESNRPKRGFSDDSHVGGVECLSYVDSANKRNKIT